MTYDELTPEERREAKRQVKAQKAQEAEDNAVVQSIMAAPPGRAWIRRRLEICQVFHSTFTGEALASAFNEGRRSVGLMILADIMQACPEQYVRMMQDGGRTDHPHSRSDPDDERNWDGDNWIGDGDAPG